MQEQEGRGNNKNRKNKLSKRVKKAGQILLKGAQYSAHPLLSSTSDFEKSYRKIKSKEDRLNELAVKKDILMSAKKYDRERRNRQSGDGDHKYIEKYTSSNGNTVYVYNEPKYYKKANGVTVSEINRPAANMPDSSEYNRRKRISSQQARMQQIEDRKARQRRAAARDAMRERQEANQRLEERRQQSLREETQKRLDMNEFLKNQAASNYTYKKETNFDRFKLKGQEIIGSILASTTKEKELLNKLGLNGYLKYKKGALEGKSPTLRKANQAVKSAIGKTKRKAKKTHNNVTAKMKDIFNK